MPSPDITVRACYSEALITELFWVYVGKIFFARTMRSAVAILVLAAAAAKELYSHRVGEGIVYFILALSLLAFTIMWNLQFYNHLASGYLLGVEFHFAGDKMSASINLNQREMPWQVINKIWVSRNLVVFVDRKKRGLAFPKQELTIEVKRYIGDQLRYQKSLVERWKNIFPELLIEKPPV